MYPRASGGLGGPQTPAYFQDITYSACIIKHSVLYIIWTLEFQLRFRAVNLFYL